ncbi:MAG: hydroxymethylbilane synthase, partial [Bacteroidaceae bacterium]|nr:hydroxymethylbilane synthase [Bacteroidaceae bacterium]
MRIITRQSKLALLQVEEVMRQYPDVHYELMKTDSYGDKHKEVSLMDQSVSPDFFTRELDAALIEGRADIAIHSAKDLPYPLPVGIEVSALSESADKSDSLVTRDGKTLRQLPARSKIGTSSEQRKAELMALRPDVEVVAIRGTIEERIAQVDDYTLDGLIVATCALDRLGLAHRASERLPFKTHPLQGNLAVTASVDVSAEIRELFSKIDVR